MLSAHDESYRRFPALAADGTAYPARGLTQFVVGTGGQALTGFSSNPQRAAYRENNHFGALRMALKDDSWTADYYNVNGTIMDSSSSTCHS